MFIQYKTNYVYGGPYK